MVRQRDDMADLWVWVGGVTLEFVGWGWNFRATFGEAHSFCLSVGRADRPESSPFGILGLPFLWARAALSRPQRGWSVNRLPATNLRSFRSRRLTGLFGHVTRRLDAPTHGRAPEWIP